MNPMDTQSKLITCILPRGKALMLLQALAKRGVVRADMSFARGSDILEAIEEKDLVQIQHEKEVVTVLAKDSKEADELFAFIYEAADINYLGGGLMYMTHLSQSSPYLLPNLNTLNK